MTCVQPDGSYLSELHLGDIEDEYHLDISESDSSDFEISYETDCDLDMESLKNAHQ